MSKQNSIVICGSRGFEDYNLLNHVFVEYFPSLTPENTLIISGGARGADFLDMKFAHDHGYDFEEHLANWEFYGNKAGVIRNHEMVQRALESENSYLLAFWDNESRGTQNAIKLAKKAGLTVAICDYNRLITHV